MNSKSRNGRSNREKRPERKAFQFQYNNKIKHELACSIAERSNRRITEMDSKLALPKYNYYYVKIIWGI